MLALNDENYFIQEIALHALQAQNNNSPEILDALKALSLSEHSRNASLYRDTMTQLFPETEVKFTLQQSYEDILLSQLASKDEEIRRNATDEIKTLPVIGENMAIGLASWLNKNTRNANYDRVVEKGVCYALSIITPNEGAGALQDLFDWFKRETSEYKIFLDGGCLQALAIAGYRDKAVINFLRDGMLKTPQIPVTAPIYSSDPDELAANIRLYRRNFTYTLAKMGDAGIPSLMEGMRSDDPIVVSSTAAVFVHSFGNQKSAVPLLLDLVKNRDKHITQCDFYTGIISCNEDRIGCSKILKTCYNSSDIFIDVIQRIAPGSPELKEAISIQKSLYPEYKDKNYVPME
jgi:hypothetical protein